MYYQVNSDRDSGSGLKHMWNEKDKKDEDNESKLKEGAKTREKLKTYRKRRRTTRRRKIRSWINYENIFLNCRHPISFKV